MVGLYFNSPLPQNLYDKNLSISSVRFPLIACECAPEGSENVFPEKTIHCDRDSGQCPCLPNVNNRKCEKCIEGYWNIDSGVGK